MIQSKKNYSSPDCVIAYADDITTIFSGSNFAQEHVGVVKYGMQLGGLRTTPFQTVFGCAEHCQNWNSYICMQDLIVNGLLF